ncbi:MAG: tail fiber domain-containing protein [Candidatus Rokuibacteriota bacterium]
MRRKVVMLAVTMLALLATPIAPAEAQFDSCALDGNYVLSAFLFTASTGQVSGKLQFTPPGACAPGAPGTVAVHLSVFLAGTSTPTPVAFAWSYAVDAGGTVDIGPGILRGMIGHHAADTANSLVFTADPALPPPAIQLAGTAVRVDFLAMQISSSRFKEDVRDIGDASRGLGRLRPVTFRYRRAEADGTHPRQYGLIAEEVAAVYPELVQYGATGRPLAVRYHELPAMLLNELQRQQRQLEAQRDELRAQADQLQLQQEQLQAQAARLAELAARLAGPEARGEASAAR